MLHSFYTPSSIWQKESVPCLAEHREYNFYKTDLLYWSLGTFLPSMATCLFCVGWISWLLLLQRRQDPSSQNCSGPCQDLPLSFCLSSVMQGQPNRKTGKSTATNQKQPGLFITACYIQRDNLFVMHWKNWKNPHYLLKGLVTFFCTLLFTLCLNKLGDSQWNPQIITSCNMHKLFTTCKKFP